MWLYSIHSNNAELIYFLEENKVEPENIYKYHDILMESIKCHHNDISNYIKNKEYNQIQTDYQNKFYNDFGNIIFDSLNFFFFPSEIESKICHPQYKGFKLSQLCFSLTIPSSVTSIGNNTFLDCSSLTQIIIPSSVTSIGNVSFSRCSLTQVSFENLSSITSFGLFVFLGCSSLTQIPIQFLNRDNEFNITFIFGSEGACKTSLSWILSGKDVKVKRHGRRETLESINNNNDYIYDLRPIPEIMIDESNKMAFIELHDSYTKYDFEITKYYLTQCLLKANKNGVKVKILVVIGAGETCDSHLISIRHLFNDFVAIFPNLSNKEKSAIGIVITKAEEDEEVIDYINLMYDGAPDCIIKWCNYLKNHQEQIFIMPKASWRMDGKLYVFKDKDKILDFIKNDQSFNPKLEL